MPEPVVVTESEFRKGEVIFALGEG